MREITMRMTLATYVMRDQNDMELKYYFELLFCRAYIANAEQKEPRTDLGEILRGTQVPKQSREVRVFIPQHQQKGRGLFQIQG